MVQVRQAVKGSVRRQGRRVVPAVRRSRAGAAAQRPALTLGDLIVAAYDAAGGETRRVARVLSSVSMARALDRRIVVE